MATPSQIFDVAVLLAPVVFWGMMLIVSMTAFVLLSAMALYLTISFTIKTLGWRCGLLFLALAFPPAYSLSQALP